ncbi:MAG: hypothetical protein HWN66_04360 [Candidatus Helarchaeota archaeon]|nr:hypothetical protein [Candidatus Helarchaeota archaeon]
MKEKKFTTLEAIIETFKTRTLSPEESFSLIVKIEQKIIVDIDALFEGLAGGYIHEIQSKIGYTKNLLHLVIESKGAFDYQRALNSTIPQLEDILTLYHKSGVPTQLEKK